MYFCIVENVYKPSNTQMLYGFCAELVDKLSECLANDPENETITIIGKFNGKYLHARKGSTVNSLVNDYRLQCSYSNTPCTHTPEKISSEEPPALISAETATMVKIMDALIQSGLEYWTYYNPEDGTHIIKFGKDLKLDDWFTGKTIL